MFSNQKPSGNDFFDKLFSKQCSHCKNSRSNGQARKTGPCVDCNEYSNFEEK